ncbi:hypothetical protein OUZ56_017540 [Daphnia magna]|uniref:Uncharacterized protein n=1 Tax=Daphnia magna TaxID=35525 RepID=A0ABR0AT13_9CRUS|nr:hypothetical protein OUZ56_017540 [Daphnia magna]
MPQQQQLLLQLQNHCRMMQQQQLRLQQQQQQQMIRTGQPFYPSPQGPFPIGSLPQQQQQNFTRAAVPQTSSVQLPKQQQQQPYMSCPPPHRPLISITDSSGVSDQELQSLRLKNLGSPLLCCYTTHLCAALPSAREAYIKHLSA